MDPMVTVHPLRGGNFTRWAGRIKIGALEVSWKICAHLIRYDSAAKHAKLCQETGYSTDISELIPTIRFAEVGFSCLCMPSCSTQNGNNISVPLQSCLYVYAWSSLNTWGFTSMRLVRAMFFLQQLPLGWCSACPAQDSCCHKNPCLHTQILGLILECAIWFVSHC